MPNSQNMVAENEPRRTALGSSVRSTILNSFPATLRGLSKKEKKKLQLNGDPMEEIFHQYTYAMSALRAPTDFMWAAEIYF